MYMMSPEYPEYLYDVPGILSRNTAGIPGAGWIRNLLLDVGGAMCRARPDKQESGHCNRHGNT